VAETRPGLLHARDFLALLWQRFLADRCFEAAGALSYATLLALVPLATAAIGMLAAFPSFALYSESASNFLFDHFMPGAARTAQGYIADFAANAKQLTWIGIVMLVVTALMMLAAAEDTLNRIFRAPAPRRTGRRLFMYWTVLTFGPLMVAMAFAASAAMETLAGGDLLQVWLHGVVRLAPTLLLLLGLTVAFRIVPNTEVRILHAAAGALLSTVLFVCAKRAFAAYLGSGETYQQIYGALAVVPVLLVWIYLSWSALLLGALFAASLGAYRGQAASGSDARALLYFVRALVGVRTAWARGTRQGRAQWLAAMPGLDEEQATRLLRYAVGERLVHEDELGMLVPTPVAPELTLARVLERGGFSIPDAATLARLAAEAAPDERRCVRRLAAAREALERELDEPFEKLLAADADGEPKPVPKTEPDPR